MGGRGFERIEERAGPRRRAFATDGSSSTYLPPICPRSLLPLLKEEAFAQVSKALLA